MPHHDIQQIRSAGARTAGGRGEQPQQRATAGHRQLGGAFRRQPPALVLGVNAGSAVPREGKNSMEQQGAGDGCQTRRQHGYMVSLHRPVDTPADGAQLHTGSPLVLHIY
ncbi:hypothetical protein VZT92_026773 [Zoarces viviparus]|uniref:Uncharacterized protein n=1 Tax=Zoarces viviparus TaxID=48416 RepID=A0AAW1DR84_ZOAVI